MSAAPLRDPKALPLFRRKPQPVEAVVTTPSKTGGKGRPTPSRKESEAAAKARAKSSAKGAPLDRRAAAADRAARSAQMREAMRTGDDRYLPPRDKGPMRRFVRDYVDTKVTFSEWALPIVILSFGIGFVGSTSAAQIVNYILLMMIVVIAINLAILSIGMRRQLAQRFPGSSTRGLTWYMASRALQLRWIRAPRAQRRAGERLPDTYR